MKHIIKKINDKFYVFSIDRYGNEYDTMRHYDTIQKAKLFKRKLQLQDICQFCHSDNITNEDETDLITCHDCSEQF